MRKLLQTIAIVIGLLSGCFAGSVTGVVQTATGGPVRNGTLTFTLSQSMMVPGTGLVTASSINCYTGNTGVIAGVPDPSTPPVTAVNPGGELPTGTYWVRLAYVMRTEPEGLTFYSAASPAVKVQVIDGGSALYVLVGSLLHPAAATGIAVYMGNSPGTETLQGLSSGWSDYVQTSEITTDGATPVATNTVPCKFYFSDEGIPTGTSYSVNMVNRNGSQIAGFPQTWCTFGGPTGTIDVSRGFPSGDCGANGVVYPRLTLETNGVLNGSQQRLNIQAGEGLTITDSGDGTITIGLTPIN